MGKKLLKDEINLAEEDYEYPTPAKCAVFNKNNLILALVVLVLVAVGAILVFSLVFVIKDLHHNPNIGEDDSSEFYPDDSNPDDGFDIAVHLSTKTTYYPQSTDRTPPPAGYEPIYFNMLARHGNREPTSGDVTKMSKLQDTMHDNAEYFDPKFAWLGSWINPFEPQDQGLLVLSGQEEHYYLSQRYMAEFPDLMTQVYKPYFYVFQSTQVSRAGQSGVSFGYGMEEGRGHLSPAQFEPFYIFSESADQDFQLRFFDNCPAYTEQQDEDVASEQQDLYSAEVLTEVAYNMSVHLGVYPHWNLTVSELQTLYKLCAYYIVAFDGDMDFCNLFDENSILALEYYQDLDTYYANGYGFPVNYESSCVLLKDIVAVMEDVLDGDSTDELAMLRFAHAETLLPLVSLLGLFKDEEPLMANSTEEFKENRQWRSSIISPFAANLVFVLYGRNSSILDGSPSPVPTPIYTKNQQQHEHQHSQIPSLYMRQRNSRVHDLRKKLRERADEEEVYYVKLMLNEKEYVIPGCKDMYCPLETFKSLYQEPLNCDYQTVCQYSPPICNA